MGLGWLHLPSSCRLLFSYIVCRVANLKVMGVARRPLNRLNIYSVCLIEVLFMIDYKEDTTDIRHTDGNARADRGCVHQIARPTSQAISIDNKGGMAVQL